MSHRSITARILTALLLLALLVPAPLPSGGTAAAGTAAQYRKDKLHPELRKQVDAAAESDQLTVVIMGRAKPRLEAVRFRGDDTVAALKAAAAQSQAPVVNYLRARGAQVLRQFWLIDAVVARVDKPTLQGLTNLSEVASIHDNFRISVPPVQRSTAAPQGGDLTWGVAKIQADRVWNELGFTGQGIRVAVLDTGVDISHPDLAGKLHSDNPGDPAYPGGWIEFDGNGNIVASNPHDSDAHGTHVSGTVAGGSASGAQIGVAPGATLMHGLVLPGGGGSFAQVVAGMQWTVEPTDANGNPAGQRPHIASMSWGAGGLRSEVLEPLRNMYFAGVLPIAAIGNCGAKCVGSPGAVFEAFAIGASAEDDSIAGFSSGDVVPKSGWENPPGEWPDQWIKPDISAPGVNVMSAVPGGGYQAWDGTSMATPHVSGTAALMLSANPSLTPDMVLEALSQTSFWDNRYGEDRPNTRFGWGRINALDATARVAYNSGIQGMVTDAASGAPLDQALVKVIGAPQAAKTKADGTFSLSLKPGVYSLAVERFGYKPAELANITVVEGQKATANAALSALPTGTIRGTVAFARTGSGLPGARVKVNSIPIRIEQTTGADGAYALRLPVGTYSLGASAYTFTNGQAAELVVTENGTTTQDFSLSSLPRVAVLGDVENVLSQFLSEQGYQAEPAWFDIIKRVGDYSTIVVNMVGKASPDEFRALVDAAHEAGVGMIFTKSFWYGWGIDLLSETYGDPVTTSFDWYPDALTAQVDALHAELLPGKSIGEGNPWMGCCPDVAWFDGYSGENLVSLKNDFKGVIGKGVGARQNANNRHVLLASLGATPWLGPANWEKDARELFLNAVRWTARAENPGPKFVMWDLKATPETVLWYQPVTASVGIKNVGELAGGHEVMLSVNDEYGGSSFVELNPNQHTTVSFDVQREPVGSYKLLAGHLTAAFRVRPPKVTVNAMSIALPPSGKGRAADPGEPAIPLRGASVDLVQKGKVIARGKLDEGGAVTFDSTASRADYTLVVRHTDYGYNTKRHYLLTMPVHVEDDSSFSFAPQAADAARLTASLSAKGASHHGTLFLANEATGQVAFELPAGQLVLSPGAYRLTNVMAYDVPGAQWAYAGEWESRSFGAGTHSYTFGGDLKLTMSDVRGQSAPTAKVNWSMWDAYGHEIAAVYQVTAGAFGPANLRFVGDTATWPATVAATASSQVKPVLTLTNPAGAIEQTGPISWAEQPKAITFALETVLTGDYSLALQAETGPYMGTLHAAARLMLPARSASRTLVMPGDTFEVTVLFDAGPSGEITLTEALPAGFTVVRQSSVPTAKYQGGSWTWVPSGKGAYRPGQTMKVTYTVQVGAGVPAGTYSLTGTVAQNGTVRTVAGPQVIDVVR